MHRRQTQNLAPFHISQLLPHHTVQSTPNRLPVLVDQHARVVVEAHDTPVLALVHLLGAHDDGVPDVAAADLVGCGDGDGVAFGAEVALLLDDDYDAVS